MQKTIVSYLKSCFDCGIMNANTNEVGAVADIIKDLSETEKNMYEACYYKSVVEAMEDKEDRYGYTPRTRMSGNFRYGYKPMVDQEPYIDAYLDDNRYNMSYNEYGAPYNEYMTAKRHYTKTGSMNDKNAMDMHAREHIDQMVDTFEEIWEDASPDLQAKIRSELTSLMNK